MKMNYLKGSKKLKNIFINLAVVLCAVLVFFIGLELLLRGGGKIYSFYNPSVREGRCANSVKDPAVQTILCAGDSFTEGVGARKGYGYPEQLEKLLRKGINKNIVVVNKGIGGNTSSLLANDLEKEIIKYAPQLVIIMIGVNNRWNYEKSSYFNLYKEQIGFLGWLDKNFSDWRVTKLIKIISLRVKSMTGRNDNQDFSAERIRQILISDVKSGSLSAYEAGLNFYSEGKIELARGKYTEALNIDRNNYAACLRLALIDISRKQYLLARDEMWQAIHTIDSKAYLYYVNVIFNLLDQLDDDSINRRFELRKLNDYLKANYKGPDKKRLLRMIKAKLDAYENDKILTDVINYDFRKILKISRKRNVPIVLQTYPRKWHHLFNNAAREISREYNIALVDNERFFEEEAKHTDIEQFFISDGHCNEYGYRIIAENAYRELIKYKFLPDNLQF